MTFTLNLSHSYRNPFLHLHSEWHAACSKYREREGKEKIASESELQQSTVHLDLKHWRMALIYFYLGPPLFIRKHDSRQFQAEHYGFHENVLSQMSKSLQTEVNSTTQYNNRDLKYTENVNNLKLAP